MLLQSIKKWIDYVTSPAIQAAIQSAVPNRQIIIFVHASWSQSAKFNSRQIFRLYGVTIDPLS